MLLFEVANNNIDSLIQRYLDKNYRMNIDDYYEGIVVDLHSRETLNQRNLTDYIQSVFGLTQREAEGNINYWWDNKEIPFIRGELEKINKH